MSDLAQYLGSPHYLVTALISKPRASAGSRTRIDCLEGNHANRYTTDAAYKVLCTLSQLNEVTEEPFYPKNHEIAYLHVAAS